MVKQERRGHTGWAGRAVLLGVALLVVFFLLPLLFLPQEERPERKETETPLPTATLPVLEPPAVEPNTGWDARQTLRLLKADGSVEELTMGDYLWGVVSAEMPASFHSEALKAQTVAARTYCLYQRSGGDKHPGADVCTDYACCQAYLTKEQAAAGWGDNAQLYTDKVTQAVEGTDGLVCLYDGAPIDAVFFSSTAMYTNDAVTVWGTEVPYLTAVASPEGEEVPGWRTEVVFTPAEFFARFRLSDPHAEFGADPATWIENMETDDTGMVERLTVGGRQLTGGQARSIFGLRSARFTVTATEEEVRFQVTGYGHGVGMSQYGANALAGEGKSFADILEWYYTGAEVAPAP